MSLGTWWSRFQTTSMLVTSPSMEITPEHRSRQRHWVGVWDPRRKGRRAPIEESRRTLLRGCCPKAAWRRLPCDGEHSDERIHKHWPALLLLRIRRWQVGSMRKIFKCDIQRKDVRAFLKVEEAITAKLKMRWGNRDSYRTFFFIIIKRHFYAFKKCSGRG